METGTSTRAEEILTVGDAARLLGLSTSRVRQLAENGSLITFRTTSGIRLFRRSAVERLARERTSTAQTSGQHTNRCRQTEVFGA